MLKDKLKPHFGLKSLIIILVAAGLVVTDLLTKHYAKASLWYKPIIRGWVEINGAVSNNQGCAFSFLNEHPEIGQPILISFTIVMLVGIAALLIFMPERFAFTKVSLGVIAAGAVGNLVDRFMFRSVRDFIGLNMLFNGNLVYCNFADFCIVVGAILLLVDLLFINEWALIPLTRRSREAQARRKEQSSDGDGKD